ncbi:MAG: CNNM domain-containing protein, partial [Actinomycetota bacterium]|nr:CNNM domain-containing protein [Actinomycetota bacterium]
MGTEVLLLVLVVALIAANAVFVAAEFSFVTVDRPSVERLAESGDRR